MDLTTRPREADDLRNKIRQRKRASLQNYSIQGRHGSPPLTKPIKAPKWHRYSTASSSSSARRLAFDDGYEEEQEEGEVREEEEEERREDQEGRSYSPIYAPLSPAPHTQPPPAPPAPPSHPILRHLLQQPAVENLPGPTWGSNAVSYPPQEGASFDPHYYGVNSRQFSPHPALIPKGSQQQQQQRRQLTPLQPAVIKQEFE